ncbi:MAG TPA: serine/threonine-protein kinase, partial [Streptosporangiaceae bacterium]
MPEDVPGYRVLEQVGQGGFSAVYRAHQERLDRVVALKVLNVGTVDDAAMRRFTRECRITGRLTGHPHVVTVLDTGMTRAGTPFIAMEYFEHGSLTDRLDHEGPLPVADVLRVGVKIASALAAVHEADVLHRDVKPQNVLVSRYGEPALTDFGIALLTESLDATHTTAFTPQHAAPEVLNGRTLRPTSDVYALGSTMYQLLAGGPAFHTEPGVGLAPLILRIVSEPPPAIPRPDLPAPVFDAVRQAMAKDPDDRFPTAIAFANSLRQIQADLGFPVTELPVSGGAHPPPVPGSGARTTGPRTGGASGSRSAGWGPPARPGPGAAGGVRGAAWGPADPAEGNTAATVADAGAGAGAAAPPGAAPSGAAPSGAAPSGAAPSGAAPSGAAPPGAAPPGAAPSGAAPSGAAPSGAAPSGAAPPGAAPSGAAPSGAAPSGA